MEISDDDIVIEVTPKLKKTGTAKRTTAASAAVASSGGPAKPAKRSAKAAPTIVIDLDAEEEVSKATKKSASISEEPKKPRGRPAKKASTEVAAVASKKVTKRASAKKSSKAKAQSDDDEDLLSLTKRPSAVTVYSDAIEEIVAPTKKRGRPKMTTSKESEKDEIIIDLTLAPTPKKRATSTSTKKSSAASDESGPIHTLYVEEPKIASRSKKTASTHTAVDVLPDGDEFILNNELVNLASAELKRDHSSVRNALTLLKEGNTVPFITRYRKEMIGEMDETHVRTIHKLALQYTALQQRKHTVLDTIKGLNKLTPELEAAIIATTSMRHLEDIYAPYKPKKHSLADQAVAKGLGEIAETLLQRPYTDHEFTATLTKHINPAKGLKSLADVMLGVQHIWAEKVSDSVRVRDAVRPIYAEFGTISTSENTDKLDEEAKQAELARKAGNKYAALPSRKRADTYAYYFTFSRSFNNLRSHNVMAINRGEREKFLKVKFTAPEPDILTAATQGFGRDHGALGGLINLIVAHFAMLQPSYTTEGESTSTSNKSHPHKSNATELLNDILAGNKKPKKPVLDEDEGDDEEWTHSASSKLGSSSNNAHSRSLGPMTIDAGSQTMHTNLIRDAILDGFKRLLHPSMIKEARNTLTELAENDSITTFGRNLKSLLLRPPVANHTILGVDPGFTHGCKLCVIDEHGKVMDTRVIFPFVGESHMLQKLREFDAIVRKFNITLIAIGNGTAHKETINFVKKYKKEANADILWCLVDESGASVYSVSPEAQAEFPNLDPAGRGAASIARRTLDPMAEIVKIPTQSIGVGSYQHDVNQKELERSLSSVVEDCVNYVGVNLNTASQPLLRRVSGLTSTQAQNIVAFRDTNGGFNSRTQLTKVKGIGPKTYTQCAGFLRLPESSEPLDNTGIHPESYPHATSLLKSLKFTSKDIVSTTKKSKVHQALEELGDLKSLADKLNVGLPTLTDIIADLKKPGRDPRATAQIVQLDNQISELEEMKVGMSLLGRVVNVTGFGAFVDVGIEVSGLVLPKDIIDPNTNLAVDFSALPSLNPGYVGDFEVLSIDLARRRYGLRVVLRKEGLPVLM